MMSCGFTVVKCGLIDAKSSRTLSVICIYIIMPCVMINAFQIEYSRSIRNGFLLAVAAAILIHIFLLVFVQIIGKPLKLSVVEKESIIYSNSGNLVIPLVTVVLGEKWVIYASAFLSVQMILMWTHGQSLMEAKAGINWKKIQTVSHEMLSGDTGYIRISEFSEVTSDQYKKAFADLKEQGMKKLVVDLRDNPGGLLTAVCGVLRQILPKGLIVYTEDKNGKREEETCDGKNELDMPLAVLVNGNSASASEIFAGAVKDYGIGTIVGTTTYGKGVVQTIQPLTDGSAVKITIAKYFTPKGNDINKKGITPDVEAELSGDITDWTELTHKEDAQLQTALKEIGQS